MTGWTAEMVRKGVCMGLVDTFLFGLVEIPETREDTASALDEARKEFMVYPSRFRQAKIDALEQALDRFRRITDV